MEYTPVTVTGATVKISGYKMVAVVDHISGGITDDGRPLNLIKVVPGYNDYIDYTPFRHAAECYCDHCMTTRQRNETFVLVDENMNSIRIGRNCLKDFIGHSPAAIVARMDVILGVTNAIEESFSYGAALYSIRDFLRYVSASINAYGWTSRREARENDEKHATADFAFAQMTNPAERLLTNEVLQQQDETVEKALEWIREKDVDLIDNDYMYNLFVACKYDTLKTGLDGIIASLIPAYQREMTKNEERKLKDSQFAESEFLGNVKERRDFDVTFLGSNFVDGMYGVVEIVRMTDGKNLIIWFASSKHEMEQGKQYRVKATVKKHNSYGPSEIKQTVVNRLKVVKEL